MFVAVVAVGAVSPIVVGEEKTTWDEGTMMFDVATAKPNAVVVND